MNRAAVLRVSGACLALPFVGGFALGYCIARGSSTPVIRLDSALFVATALSITALPTLGRIMIEVNLARTRLGVIAISSAAVNDVVGWLLLALVTALTVSDFVAGRFALRIAMVAAVVFVSVKLVRPLLKGAIRKSRPRAGKMSANLLGGLLAVIFIAAMTTYQIGIFAIFGGFLMGVILYDEQELVAAWRERIGDFVTVFFLPIFFTYTGLRTSIGGLDRRRGVGLVPCRRDGGLRGEARRRLLCGARFRLRSRGVGGHGIHDEHPGPDGTDRDQRGSRSGRDFAEGVHDAGHHGDLEYRDHDPGAAVLPAGIRTQERIARMALS